MRCPRSVGRVTAAGLFGLMILLSGLAAAEAVLKTQKGMATYYAKSLEGQKTASGETLDNSEMMAAHRSWPFGTTVRVTAVETDESVVVTIVDRIGHTSKEVVIDLSRAAARKLEFLRSGEGKIPVRLEVLEWGDT